MTGHEFTSWAWQLAYRSHSSLILCQAGDTDQLNAWGVKIDNLNPSSPSHIMLYTTMCCVPEVLRV